MAPAVLEKIERGLSGKLGEVTVKSDRRLYIDVALENLVDAVRYLWGDLGARYVIASGMHHPDCFEVLHHFAFDGDNVVVSLRVKADVNDPHIPSITPVMKGAEFIEREMHELLGIEFDGHPNLALLLLPEDWPEGDYPLRRDYPLGGKFEDEK